jgi:hypothetical protein
MERQDVDPPEEEPTKLPFVDLGRSGQSDVSERVEEILAEEWDPDRDVDAGLAPE